MLSDAKKLLYALHVGLDHSSMWAMISIFVFLLTSVSNRLLHLVVLFSFFLF